ncbi:MAG: TIGR03936 family radical SAM-associated protein [Cloacibacillus sp.]
MPRIRIIFEKCGLFTFVNHMDLPVIFARAARRAGLSQEFTQGFSPHPRISLAAPLAIGVEGFCEPADFWFEKWEAGSLELWNEMLPEGLNILKGAEVPDGAALAKFVDAALYRVTFCRGVLPLLAKEAAENAANAIGALRGCEYNDGVLLISVGDLERCGGGFFVKVFTEAGLIEGWSDLCIERLVTGAWDEETNSVRPLL